MPARRRSKKVGLPPGTTVHVGRERAEKVRLTLFRYGPEGCQEREPRGIAECLQQARGPEIAWLNVDGVHDVSVIEEVGRSFGIHPLTLEDIANTDQRPKLESYDRYVYIVFRMLKMAEGGLDLEGEQVSLLLVDNLLISFQEREGDVFNQIRSRLREGRGQIRRRGVDYLAYCLMDATVDHYFAITEALEDRIEPLEERILREQTNEDMRLMQALKRDLIFLRRTLWPTRELLAQLERSELPAIRTETRPFLRDVYDHTIQVIELLDAYQAIVSGLVDTYLSAASNRMNNVMRVLTIIATIFIPLTFVVGVYGMNFHTMPELAWKWGYPTVWAVMLILAGVMLYIFKKKKWL